MTNARIAKLTASVAALILVAGLIIPQFKADRYRSRIESALEAAIGRKVSIGEVRFNLLTGPGFTVGDVTVAEDPTLGLEPIAYVGHMTATPRILSLLTGHLAFSSLTLDDAHLNLARVDLPKGEYRWNLEPLLRPALIAAFPNLIIRGARINFKAANLKSVVYLLDSNLAIEPPSSASSPWHFRFEGKPARTDRPARGSGVLRARGTWKPGALEANLQLEQSELGDLVAVIRGEDAGLHGLISGNARFTGPLGHVTIDGRLRIEELHGWDQDIPKGENWPLELHGLWSSTAQQLELDATVAGKGISPLAVHYLVEQYLTQPRWGASVKLTNFPAGPLVSLARHMGLGIAPGFEVTGAIDGAIGYSVTEGYAGQGRMEQATVKWPDNPVVKIDKAEILVTHGVAHLHAGAAEAVVDADYTLATGASRFRVAASGLDITTLAVLPQARSGHWSGALVWANNMWEGDMQLSDVEVPSPGLADPVFIESAQCHWEDGDLTVQKMRAHAGAIRFSGEYRYQAEATHPHRFRIAMDQVDADALETLLMPTLRRPRRILELPFRKQPLPEWLAGWHAEGTVQIASLENALQPLSAVRARFQWDAGRVSVTEIASTNLTGRATVDLRAPEPVYELTAKLHEQQWKGGQLTVDTTASLHGTGKALLASLRASGAFTASNADDDVDKLTGRYTLAWKDPVPQLAFTGLRVQSSADVYTGKGNLQDDGTVLLQLATPTKQAHLMGPLMAEAPLKWIAP